MTIAPSLLLAGLLVALVAGVVRGFAGFGFSALTVAGMSLFMPPASIVPVALVLEVLASLSLLRSTAHHADRDWLRWLVAGNAVFIPVGVALLTVLPDTLLRLLVGAALMTTAAGLRIGVGYRFAPSRRLRATAGVVSGLLTGVAASGGVVAAMLMTASGMPPAALRGTMITFLVFCGSYALVCAALATTGAMPASRLLGPDTLVWGLVLGSGMLTGIRIGRHLFEGADPARFHGFVLNLLIFISGLGVARAAYDLAGN
ncbi:MAG: sulfite exporter TauE/SafE family protein [Methylibium sp.]|nr:sulfite exporter TauE/SafE family protein [Methylibium sp.]